MHFTIAPYLVISLPIAIAKVVTLNIFDTFLSDFYFVSLILICFALSKKLNLEGDSEE